MVLDSFSVFPEGHCGESCALKHSKLSFMDLQKDEDDGGELFPNRNSVYDRWTLKKTARLLSASVFPEETESSGCDWLVSGQGKKWRRESLTGGQMVSPSQKKGFIHLRKEQNLWVCRPSCLCLVEMVLAFLLLSKHWWLTRMPLYPRDTNSNDGLCNFNRCISWCFSI